MIEECFVVGECFPVEGYNLILMNDVLCHQEVYSAIGEYLVNGECPII